MGALSHARGASNFTLNNSWVSSTLLTPCSHYTHQLALETEGAFASRGVQLLQYFAKPIDSVIQAVAMLAFTFYDHFRDISYDLKSRNIRTLIVKSLLTPINLPLKMLAASVMSLGFLSGGIFQLVIPYQTIYSVVKGKQAAHFYFYENKMWDSLFDDSSFRMKPIKILKSFDIDDDNPLWLKRKKILEEIDESLRHRINGTLDISTPFPDYQELLKNKDKNEKFILDNIKFILGSNIHDEDVKLKLNAANQSLERLKEIDEKIRLAKRQWEEIDQISLGWDVVMNDGIPLLMKGDY